MADLRVLYDGWSLIYDPLSPQAMHLQAVLAHLPSQVSAIVALPQEPLPWIGGIESHVRPTPNKPSGRLRWEQFTLPGLVRKINARILHLTTPTAPLSSDVVTLVSLCDYDALSNSFGNSGGGRGFVGRLRGSLARGGISRIAGYLWPADLPGTNLSKPLLRLPPVVPPGFTPTSNLVSPGDNSNGRFPSVHLPGIDLPDTFLLYHGPNGQRHLEQLVAAWKWAAPAIGDYHPLVAVGLNAGSQQILNRLAVNYNLGGNLYPLSGITPELLPELYRKCSAVFHPAPASPWSGAVRLALVAGKPLVATERTNTDAIVGPAAYLAQEGNARALGAALVTIVVEEHIAEQLSRLSLQRSTNWQEKSFAEHLLAVYSQVI
jgi:glycosyltransferase involved in cell wall biosynthesis